MAGRRARMLVTAAGPATGLVLAGSMQLVGLAVPALGPLAFKLAFAWYLNALFNLNPFLALDGYYLLMDWLEIPNLRGPRPVLGDRPAARPPAALVGAGPRGPDRRPVRHPRRAVAGGRGEPRLPDLGRPGRRAGHRAVAQRLGGPAAARRWWCSGSARRWSTWPSAGCARLVAPVARARRRAATARPTCPRRLAALRDSDLGGLPEPALAGLAARARWLHPPTGRQLVIAGRPPAGRLRGRRRRPAGPPARRPGRHDPAPRRPRRRRRPGQRADRPGHRAGLAHRRHHAAGRADRRPSPPWSARCPARRRPTGPRPRRCSPTPRRWPGWPATSGSR